MREFLQEQACEGLIAQGWQAHLPSRTEGKLDRVRVWVKANLQEVSKEAARFVADAVRLKPEITLALPTGRTPLIMYAELVNLHRAEGLDFSRARIFSLDEYCGMPDSDPRTFRQYLWSRFLSHINIRPENVTLCPSSSALCDVYEASIRNAGGIDLLVAGLGTNGHIAFNEPGSPFDSRTRQVHLASSTVDAMRHEFTDAELPRQAITLGIATFLEARQILLLAAGLSKKEPLRRALHGPVTEAVPASALRAHRDVTIIADETAADQGRGAQPRVT